jgi:hypothetical protein
MVGTIVGLASDMLVFGLESSIHAGVCYHCEEDFQLSKKANRKIERCTRTDGS